MVQILYNKDESITIWTPKGRLSFNDIQETVDDNTAATHLSRVLCDLSNATTADLTGEEIETIVTIIARKITKSKRTKAAIVADKHVDYGMARMFGAYTKMAGLPVEVKVFKAADIAKEWLSSKDS